MVEAAAVAIGMVVVVAVSWHVVV